MLLDPYKPTQWISQQYLLTIFCHDVEALRSTLQLGNFLNAADLLRYGTPPEDLKDITCKMWTRLGKAVDFDEATMRADVWQGIQQSLDPMYTQDVNGKGVPRTGEQRRGNSLSVTDAPRACTVRSFANSGESSCAASTERSPLKDCLQRLEWP